MTTQVNTVVAEKPLVSRKNDPAAAVVPSKPDWHEDLALEPHHFQQQDRYHEDLLRHALRMAVGHPWGIVDCALEEASLAAGQVAVRRILAIFPDGAPVVASAIPPRYFERNLRGRGTLDVYLGLPLERAGEGVVAARGGADGATSRYLDETASVTDLNTGRNPVEVRWLRPNVQILFEGEALDAFSLLKVARLQKAASGIQLDPRFVAPVLRVRASSALEARVRAVEKSALATMAAIGDLRVTGGEMTGNDAVRFLLASTLGRELALLQGVLSSETAHPREAYRSLAGLVGAVAAFTPSGRAKVPGFDPLNLEATFDALEREAREVLDVIAAPPLKPIALEPRGEGTWCTQPQREPGVFGREFVLVLTGGDAATYASVPHVTKVAAWEEIGRHVSHSVPGVVLVPEVRRPRGISLPPDAACFRFDKRSSGPVWQAILNHGSIAVWTGLNGLKPMLLTQEPGVLGAAG